MKIEEFIASKLTDNSMFSFRRTSKNVFECSDRLGKTIPLRNDTYYSNSQDVVIHQFLETIQGDLSILFNNKDFIEKNLMIFGDDREYEHNTNDKLFLYQSKKSSMDGSCLETGNLVGYVSKKIDNKIFTIGITSRFGDNFLKHLVAASDGFLAIDNFGDIDSTGLAEWLLVFLWKVSLLKAYRLGIPKMYVGRHESVVSIRGNIDINKVAINPAYIPPYECTYFEHSYNNSVTRLIFNTFRFITNKDLIQDIHKIRQDFSIATGASVDPVNKLLGDTEIRNPYYLPYTDVAKISKKIITRQMAFFGTEESDLSAFLFDISMLFEHFIRKILIHKGYRLNTKNKSELSVPNGISGNKILPDIIVYNDDGSCDIFDVKYKHFSFQQGVLREDIFQINTYVGQVMNQTAVRRCGFIYPLRASRVQQVYSLQPATFMIAGNSVSFEILFFIVPDDKETDYSLEFKNSINDFLHQFSHGGSL